LSTVKRAESNVSREPERSDTTRTGRHDQSAC
jgi:hypothetical protein